MKLVRRLNTQLPHSNDWFNHLMGRDFFMEPSEFFGSRMNTPKVNIKENEDAYQIEMAAPGYEKNDFNVEIDNHVLSISVDKEENSDEADLGYSVHEYRYGSFHRSFNLPKGKTLESKISGKYENGILTIEIPKTEEAKPKPKRVLDIL